MKAEIDMLRSENERLKSEHERLSEKLLDHTVLWHKDYTRAEDAIKHLDALQRAPSAAWRSQSPSPRRHLARSGQISRLSQLSSTGEDKLGAEDAPLLIEDFTDDDIDETEKNWP